MRTQVSPLTIFLRLLLSMFVAGQGLPPPAWASALVQLRVSSPYTGNPSAVTNLQAEPDFSLPEEQGKIRLNWSTPSDAGGKSVFSYLIKYATFSVAELSGDTTTWWNHPLSITATESSIPPNFGRTAKAAPGSTETFVISGLVSGDFYYFGVKVIDRYNRLSDRDAQFRGITTQGRAFATTPPWTPSKVTDLVGASLEIPARVRLTWTMPSFWNESNEVVPGHIKQPGLYCIQYSTALPPTNLDKPNQPNNWTASVRHYISTQNVRTGDLQSYVLTGLTQNTTYYIHIFTRNEWPDKWSSESAPLTLVRPYISLKAVENLFAVAGGSTTEGLGSFVTLSWKNPSDEQFFRGARIVFSTTSYPPSPNESNFIDVEPLVLGDTTDYVHIQLLPRTTHYYSIFAYDINRFYSSATYTSVYTNVDLLAPSEISNITSFISLDRTGDSDKYNINLSWTKPTTPLHRNIDYEGARIYFSTLTPDAVQHTFLAAATGRTFVHEVLTPYTTYFYSFASYDAVGNKQPVSERSSHLVYISEKDVPPSPPVLISSIYSSNREFAEGCKLALRWKAPAEIQVERIVIRAAYDDFPSDISKGEQFLEYFSAPGEESSREFKRLLSLTTHYISIFAVSKYGLASMPVRHSFYTHIPWTDTVAPFKPLDLRIVGRQMTWSPVAFNAELKAIPNPSTPDISDVYFYEIHTSTSIRGGWGILTRLSPTVTSYNLPISDGVRYYKCRALDASGNFADSYVLDSNKNIYALASDKSFVFVPGELFETEKSGKDKFVLSLSRNTSDEKGSIYKSLNVRVDRLHVSTSSLTLENMQGFNLGSSKCKIAFSYEVSDGKLKFGAPSVNVADATNSLGIFYFNGVEWTRLNTVVVDAENSVKSNIRFAGTYHLRYSPTTGEFAFYDVVPKIITPNNDELNDRALFRFSNPKLQSVSLKIFDINSALVKDIGETTKTSDIPGEYIFWDGTDKDNRVVQPGVYLYQLEVDGKVINGTIVVAR